MTKSTGRNANIFPMRETRYSSHALVELKKFRYLPFMCYSAVLLDISKTGFKVELTCNETLEPGTHFWLTIPLRPLGIYASNYLKSRVECKWFDSIRFRLGGSFLDLSQRDKFLIEQVVDALDQLAE